jgi:hypothetical protein
VLQRVRLFEELLTKAFQGRGYTMHYTLPLFIAAAHARFNAPNLPRVAVGEAAPLPTLFSRQQFAEPCEEVSASWAALAAEATGAIYVGAKVC